MLRSFEISAPGKIILHGEHSVVYNKPAIAGPIGLRTYFNFQETSADFISFSYQRLQLTTKLSIKNANLLLTELDFPPIDFLQKFRSSSEFILKFIEADNQRKLNDKEQMAVGATLYIFSRVLRNEKIQNIKTSFDIRIDSDMSIGAGVGSSASYGVCLAATFFAFSKLINGELSEDFLFAQEDLAKISQWAFDSEVIMHEKPSGIDNTICTYGQLIKFSRGQTPEPIKTNATIDILLVDTGVGRSTAEVVRKVVEFRNKHSKLSDAIFDAMGFLVDDVVTILEGAADKYQELAPLVSVNNNLLRSLDVSHPRLEKIFSIAESHGFNAKLTGAGAGGCAFVLLPQNYKELESYAKMCEELEVNEFKIMSTIIGGRGVGIKF